MYRGPVLGLTLALLLVTPVFSPPVVAEPANARPKSNSAHRP